MTVPRSLLRQPLSLRRDYGAKRREPSIAESGLPSGGPSDKGLPLDSGIPGTNTYAKPVDDIRDFDNSKSPKDENIYRVEMPDDLVKDRDRIDTKEDWGQSHDNIGIPGKGKPDRGPKTKYPYRDDRKHTHNAAASAAFVAGLHLLSMAPEVVLEALVEDGHLRVAKRLGPIEEGLNPKYIERAQSCSVTMKRVDIPHLRWLFSVDCGNGPKVVRMKATRVRSNVSAFVKLDLHLTCSCQAWRWQGPEHWSKNEDYIDGKPRGTASPPIIRDPFGMNRVCKHVEAVLSHVRDWKLGRSRRTEPS